MRGRLGPLVLTAAVLASPGCGNDPPPPCEDACDLCCDQEQECLGTDRDACYAECVQSCQRSSRVLNDTTCFSAKLALEQCICSLSCTDLAAFELGTSTQCAAEVADEAHDCSWF